MAAVKDKSKLYMLGLVALGSLTVRYLIVKYPTLKQYF